jgi:hypothetical protein
MNGVATAVTQNLAKVISLTCSATPISVFFSEYRFNKIEPQTFTNVPALYGKNMTILSGGLVYEYYQESENYNLVSINSSEKVTLIEDYNYLKQQFANLDQPTLTKVNNTGVSVSATTMPATVYNYTGGEVSGLALVSLGCKDSNWPGLIDGYTTTSQSCSYATSTGSSSSDDYDDNDSGAGRIDVDTRAMAVVGVVLAMFSGVSWCYDRAFETYSIIFLFIANKGSCRVHSGFLDHDMRENTNWPGNCGLLIRNVVDRSYIN